MNARTVANVIARVLWGLVLVGAGLGAWHFGFTYYAEVFLREYVEISAPQIAALAAESLVLAVIPYVLARAWDEITRRPRP
jgi:hypothetical protein